MNGKDGFTLLEVLVALAVLAIAMAALLSAATQSVAHTRALREQTFAEWVALNQISARLLDPEPWPEEGTIRGSTELANRMWYWEIRFAKTQEPDLRRMEVLVWAEEGGEMLTGLIALRAHLPQAQGMAEEPARSNVLFPEGSTTVRGFTKEPLNEPLSPGAPLLNRSFSLWERGRGKGEGIALSSLSLFIL